VGVAAVVENGTARVALTNMGPTPIRASAVESAWSGDPGAAAELAAEGTEPTDDVRATAEFKKHLARVLVKRALEEAQSR
jgi:carbon-monoxide dehydrogenase medium subunit